MLGGSRVEESAICIPHMMLEVSRHYEALLLASAVRVRFLAGAEDKVTSESPLKRKVFF